MKTMNYTVNAMHQNLKLIDFNGCGCRASKSGVARTRPWGLVQRVTILLAVSLAVSVAALAQSEASQLTFVTPTNRETISGTNLLIWVADSQPYGVSGREVLFQWSEDGVLWNTLPWQESPDFGNGSYTTTVDTTMLPSGPLYLRASPLPFGDEFSATVQVYVNQSPQITSQGPINSAAAKMCEVTQLTINAKGKSVETDFRRGAQGPLGLDPAYLSLNFEAVATLANGSDPALCPEGQTVSRTATVQVIPQQVSFKQACSAGKDLAICANNPQCDVIAGDGTGVCSQYPFPGPRGNDDYKSPMDLGVKTHNPTPMWWDAPGSPRTRRVNANVDYIYMADFLSTIKGATTAASCHFEIFIFWDGTNKKYLDGSKISLIPDKETVNCTLNK
jgi:hypothetical protein